MEKLASGEDAHGARGVMPFGPKREKKIKKVYKNGEKCGEIDVNIVMQGFISNPLLIEGHKFDIRTYLLIASTKPFIAYYHDGPFRVSLFKYDETSSDKKSQLANFMYSVPDDMTEKEQERLISTNFDDLGNYLLKEGIIKDKSWIETGLKYQMKRSYIHLINATKKKLITKPNYYEILGCDFMLDAVLKIWFIECNSDYTLTYPERFKGAYKIVKPMLRDHFEIMLAYYRSRMKRIILFVNRITQKIKEDGYTLTDIKKKKKAEFAAIDQNYLEPEFKISKNNGWVKIMDENLISLERYGNLFPIECK